jgi:integrase
MNAMYIKRPGNGRASYSIIGRDGKTVADPRIEAVNRDLSSSPRDELEERMQRILDDYRTKQQRLPLSHCNLRLATEVHKQTLVDTKLVRPEWDRYILNRAAQLLGNRSIHTVTKIEIGEAIAHLSPGGRYHVVGAMNRMLRAAGRDFTLRNKQPTRIGDPPHLKPRELKSVLNGLIPAHQLTIGALFATGCRWGELPVAEFHPTGAHIRKQLLDSGKIGPPKNKHPRTTRYIEALSPFVSAYASLPAEHRRSLRLTTSVYKAFKRRTSSLGMNDGKGLCLHHLRHSYVIEQRAQGVDLPLIAEYIGDDYRTMKEHYLNKLEELE